MMSPIADAAMRDAYGVRKRAAEDADVGPSSASPWLQPLAWAKWSYVVAHMTNTAESTGRLPPFCNLPKNRGAVEAMETETVMRSTA